MIIRHERPQHFSLFEWLNRHCVSKRKIAKLTTELLGIAKNLGKPEADVVSQFFGIHKILMSTRGQTIGIDWERLFDVVANLANKELQKALFSERRAYLKVIEVSRRRRDPSFHLIWNGWILARIRRKRLEKFYNNVSMFPEGLSRELPWIATQ